MNRKRIFNTIRMFMLGMIVVVLSTAHNAAAETTTITALSAWPRTASETLQFLKFVKLFQAEADLKYPGEIKIDYKGAGEVIKNTEQVEALRTGLIDMVFMAGSYYTSIIPEVDIMSLSTKTPWQEKADGVLDYLEQIHNKKANAHVLGRVGSGSYFHVFLSKPISSMADFKGLKLRSSATPVPFIKSMGVNPVGMPPPDIYTAMERGVVDGYILPPATIRDFGLIKASKYMVYPGFYKPATFILMNLDKWNKLPAHLQELLTTQTEEMAHYAIAAKHELLIDDLADFEKQGMKFVVLEPADAEKFTAQAEATLVEAISKKSPEETKKLLEMIK
jgi:TRAP-type C4-dicarboxylate transport system substrate-binding protein